MAQGGCRMTLTGSWQLCSCLTCDHGDGSISSGRWYQVPCNVGDEERPPQKPALHVCSFLRRFHEAFNPSSGSTGHVCSWPLHDLCYAAEFQMPIQP